MMIVAKRAFQFNDWLITQKDHTYRMPDGTEYVVKGEKTATALNTFVIKPSTRPQYAPDWIAQDELFTIAQRDGNLKVIP